jgi:hypothetical protein
MDYIFDDMNADIQSDEFLYEVEDTCPDDPDEFEITDVDYPPVDKDIWER